MGDILVGTSSWADRLLISSGWYPRAVNNSAGRLSYYADFFHLVEVDTSYYAIPAVETVAAWVNQTPEFFTFDVKAFSLFTGHPTPVSTLPRDLRPSAGVARSAAARVRRKDLTPESYDELWARFHAALEPIVAADKLGVVLLQFPPWLARSEGAKRRITEEVQRCRPLSVAVELRHGSWFTQDVVLDTLVFLRELDASFCCVDMPQGHASSVPPILVATADPAVVRFHGHSSTWGDGDKQAKFRYAYRDDELIDWVQRLRGLAEEVDQVHVLMNNCCGGQAQRDAARLATLLGTVGADISPVRRGPGRVAGHAPNLTG